MKVHIWGEFSQDTADAYQTGLHSDIELTLGNEINPETHVLVKGTPDEADLTDQLEHIIIPWAGLPESTRNLLTGRKIQVHNIHHNASATAETAIALMLAVARKIVPFDQSMRQSDWAPRYHSSETISLHKKHAVILGYGAIGQRIANACRGLGMEVSAIKRTVRQGFDGDVSLYALTGLKQLLSKADVLFVSLPLTDETKGLIGNAEINHLKPTTILVNIARGAIIEESALYEALAQRKIYGAGLDVWWNYPEGDQTRCHPGEHPWHDLDNLVMSPHVGGAHQDNEPARIQAVVELLNRIYAGDEESNLVDLSKGY